MKQRRSWLVGALALMAVCARCPAVPDGSPEADRSAAARRAALVRQAARGPASLPQLAHALGDQNPVVRRTAVRLLAGMGAPARAALGKALGSPDFVVRRAALWAVCDPLTTTSLPFLETALKDGHPALRATAARLLVAVQPRTEAVGRLLNTARADADAGVRDVAARALWPFHKETVLVRDRKDWDHEVKVVQTIPLPKGGWRFRTDPMAGGHLKGWFDPGFDDSGWAPIEIERAWEQQGHDYDGVAWYRGSFDLAAHPDHLAVELHFDGVDECAWVWVNGRYAGQHDIGPDGWDKPFALDVTQDVRWGQRNQITVRVYDSVQAGGIWRPVRIEALK